MSLSDWSKNGWLREHETNANEIGDLLAVIERDLTNCVSPHLDPDWQLAIAYNAILQAATAALAACGYRAGREAHHFRVIQSLAFTLEYSSGKVAAIDAFRKKRNVADYERAGTVSEQEAREIIALADQMQDDLAQWLKQKYPQFLGSR